MWELNLAERELIDIYRPALMALGVDLYLEEVQEAFEGCTSGLEDCFRSAIVYMLWLQSKGKEIVSPNAILIESMRNRWTTKYWKDDFIELPQLQSLGQRWWRAAQEQWGYDVRNRLVSNVYFDNEREYIKFSNGRTLRVDTAYRCGWNSTLEYATTDNPILRQ
ncbi:hypothetical protein [Nostoc sp.]|uniref:hypothetical protein n=1 Tax=Nostoc sp. TaxID=1180 RepID=UPI002FF56AB6